MRGIYAIVGLIISTLLLSTQPAVADVPQNCVTRYNEAGAAPGTASCFNTALLSPASLANFFCGAEEAREYCGCPAG